MISADFLFAASVVEAVERIVLVAAIAVVTTPVALRLLGTRRGWGTSLLSAVLGWGVAGLLALGLGGWDWDADSFTLYALAIGVPATMVVAVGIDLLARPGSLAVGELAGLVVAPRPLRAIRVRAAVFLRYRELLQIARRYGFGAFLAPGGRTEGDLQAVGDRLRRALEEAGGVYIKVGQIAATRIDLLPPEICAELSHLQNRVAEEPAEHMRAALEEELGASVESVFPEFDWTPLAAASIGQTYRARLSSGEAVVVKVQRPAIREDIERDLAALSLLANVAQRRTELGQGLRSSEMLDHFAKSLRTELDFGREAEVMVEMATLLEGSGIRIPKVYRHLCSRRLLVQERFEGSTVADAEQLAVAVDREQLAEQLLRSTLDQVLRVGVFHADPHPGNVFVFRDGSLGLIDFGAVGRLDSIQQNAVIDMLGGLVRRDVSLLRNAIERVADVAEAASSERVERALARLIADNIGPTGTIAPTVLQDLVSMLARLGIRLPGDLVVLSRALITLDGTLRVLSPTLSLVPAVTALMKPTASSAILDPEALIRDELLSVLPRLRRLPDHIDRILTVTARGDLRIRTVVDEDGQRLLRTFVNRLMLVGIGFAFLAVSGVLLVADEDGPRVADATGLFEVLGYVGLLLGTVLLLRVASAVARDGTT